MRRGGILVAALLIPLVAAAAAAARQPRLDARAWALIDARTGEVLASHAARRELPVASTTKLMTAYVVLHELPLSRIVRTVPYHATYGESLLGLRRHQRISVRDLLYGLVLRSGNDAAYELALAAAGSEARFVRQMNRAAARLRLRDTHYANPIGLDQRGNHSSALDLVTLARRLLRLPVFARIADTRQATLRSVHPRRRIATVNELLRLAPWANGVKTGHTVDARYVLVGAGRRDGVELISAVVGAADDEARFGGSLRLLDFGFAEYRRRLAVRTGEELADPSVSYGGGVLPLVATRSVPVTVRRGQPLEISLRVPRSVSGPVRLGARLGRALVALDGRRLASVPLVALRAVARAGALQRLRALLLADPIFPAAALFVILIGMALLWRRVRHRPKREMRWSLPRRGQP